jgi:phosphoheptose isomerase
MAKRILQEIVNVYFSRRDFTVTIRLACTHEYVYEAGNEFALDAIYSRQVERLHKRTRCQLCEDQATLLDSYEPVE